MSKKIHFIGLRGSGKTTLITGTSNFLANEFMTSSTYINAESLLKTQKIWGDIVNKEIWPVGTDRINRFDFLIRFNNEIIDFSLLDYRGGILIDFNPCSIKERVEFLKDLDDSAGLIFSIPADTIIEALDGDDDAIDDINMLNRFILQYASKNSLIGIPIAISITKGELFESAEEITLALKIIKSVLNILFAKGNHISVFITIVGLDRTEKNIDSFNSVFKNYHLPILFCLFRILSESHDKILKNTNPIDMVISKTGSTESNDISNIRNNRLLLKNIKEELIIKGEYYINGELIQL
jgi:GTPase SAR1 family protein